LDSPPFSDACCSAAARRDFSRAAPASPFQPVPAQKANAEQPAQPAAMNAIFLFIMMVKYGSL
jgi:hypothetical protein